MADMQALRERIAVLKARVAQIHLRRASHAARIEKLEVQQKPKKPQRKARPPKPRAARKKPACNPCRGGK